MDLENISNGFNLANNLFSQEDYDDYAEDYIEDYVDDVADYHDEINQDKFYTSANSIGDTFDVESIHNPSAFSMVQHGKDAKERSKIALKGFAKGLRTFDKLDEITYGLRKEMQIVLFGESKSGKSTILQNMLFNALVDNISKPPEERYKIFVSWFSLEMTGISLFQRFMSYYLYNKYGIRYSYSDLEGFTDNKLTEEEIDMYYDEAIAYVSSLGHINVYDIPKTVDQITATLRDIHLSAEAKGKFDINGKFSCPENHMFINILDHTRLISPGKEKDEFARAEGLSKAFYRSRNTYRDCNIILSQTNSTINDEENAKNDYVPQNQHLFGGKGVVQDADLILAIGAPYLHKLAKFPSRGDSAYDIRRLRNRFRCVSIILSRFCDIGAVIPLDSDFATSTVSSLPSPERVDYSRYQIK